ncbi:MAG: hypothetical protein F9K29_07995 [Hyphomicrobiaceae bacterium]|nr:MAG: hypothetical protein F9K29_07995 [Hyphomicrobiaceae bacterium]
MNVTALEIAAMCARHFGVSPRALAFGEPSVIWGHADEARAVAIHLIRRRTATPCQVIANLFGVGASSNRFALIEAIDRQTSGRARTDDLLLAAIVQIGCQIRALHEVRERADPAIPGRAA